MQYGNTPKNAPQSDKTPLIVAAAIAGVLALIAFLGWRDSLGEYARLTLNIGALAALVFAGATAWAYFETTTTTDKTLTQVKVEMESWKFVAGVAAVVALICFFAFPFAQKADEAKKDGRYNINRMFGQ